MARTKRVRSSSKKVAEDDANGNTGAVPDENTVDDEGSNKDALAPAVSARLSRHRVSSGGVEDKINDGERDVERRRGGRRQERRR